MPGGAVEHLGSMGRADRAADPAGSPSRQHRLRGQLAEREVTGRLLAQWQYEVTAGGRIWYCPDEQRRIVWVVATSPSHPKVTD